MNRQVTSHRLRDLCEKVFQGLSQSRQVGGDTEYSVIYIRDLHHGRINPATLSTTVADASALEDYGVKKGDVLVSAKGTIGKAALVTEDAHYLLSSNLIALRPNARFVDPAYLYAYFCSDHAASRLDSLARASATVRSIRVSDVLDLTIPLPDPATQERLGRLAVAFDDYRTLANICVTTLEGILNQIITSRIAGKEEKHMAG